MELLEKSLTVMREIHMHNRKQIKSYGFIIIVIIVSIVSILFATAINEQFTNAKRRKGWKIIKKPGEISAIAEQDDIIWVGGRDGVWAINKEDQNIIKRLDSDVPLRYVRALLVDESGVLWIGHEKGLTTYDGNSYYTYTTKDGLPDHRVNALMLDNINQLWIGTWSGVVIKNDTTWEVLTTQNGLAENMVNVMYQDTDGGIWFGSYCAPKGGVSYLKKGKWQYFTIDNGLPHNNITSIEEDVEGQIWIGTGLLDRGGASILKMEGDQWKLVKTIHKKDGIAGEKVRSIFKDREGVLWVGSEYDGVARYANNIWQIFNVKDGLSHNEVKKIIQDAEGNLWLGTLEGITYIRSDALNALLK